VNNTELEMYRRGVSQIIRDVSRIYEKLGGYKIELLDATALLDELEGGPSQHVADLDRIQASMNALCLAERMLAEAIRDEVVSRNEVVINKADRARRLRIWEVGMSMAAAMMFPVMVSWGVVALAWYVGVGVVLGGSWLLWVDIEGLWGEKQ